MSVLAGGGGGGGSNSKKAKGAMFVLAQYIIFKSRRMQWANTAPRHSEEVYLYHFFVT
jgi:hypothetical protein